ncbi:hypothetical protein [Novosphingobium sp. MMS21-SN21R]|uniref:hypothetical protein n=1 Tax=Novosphingobium sp. MMS21-SN21R TaxID=2969298 RepID=UPI0028841354|nr:hypothetical protein [Novosphingobium sp. MMS21-SN21R]MDT0508239.1 hypothetical protein [Novosphingobium sp. MMS21-SN21R]
MTTDWSTSLTAAMAWWRDAGLDGTFVDEPQDWLAEARRAKEQAPAPAMKPLRDLPPAADSVPTVTVGTKENWPQALADFSPWWLAEGALAPAGLRRLPPIGAAQAELMVLVPMPAADDGDALLSGRAGRLLDAMLSAMAIDKAQTYLASALPAHVPMPDWQALGAVGIGDVLLHHIALAAPKRLLILGASGVSALLGHDPTNLAHGLRAINQETAGMAVMPAWDLDAMLARPALKAGFWSRWLDWTGTLE